MREIQKSHKQRIAVAACISLVAASMLLSGQLPKASAATSTGLTSIKVMTANISGASTYAANGEVRDRAASIVKVVLQNDVDIVGLQEVCYHQYLAMKKPLEAQGYQMNFNTANKKKPCSGKDDLWGDVIASKGKVTKKLVIALPTPSKGRNPLSEPRFVLGQEVVVKGQKVTALTTHFSQFSPDREVQATALQRIVEKHQLGSAVVVAGDLNLDTDTPSLQSFKRQFSDPDMFAGGPTALNYKSDPKKIDHTFWDGDLQDRTTITDPLLPQQTYLTLRQHRFVIAWGTLERQSRA